jgi:hypothetical protein
VGTSPYAGFQRRSTAASTRNKTNRGTNFSTGRTQGFQTIPQNSLVYAPVLLELRAAGRASAAVVRRFFHNRRRAQTYGTLDRYAVPARLTQSCTALENY